MIRFGMWALLGAALCAPAYAATVQDELMAADRAFAQLASEIGTGPAFEAYASDDVRLLLNNNQPTFGIDELRRVFSNPTEGATLTWEPEEALAGEGDDFGVTWGRYVSTVPKEDGPDVRHGKYVTVWKRDAAGEWKFILDGGNINPDPASDSDNESD